jgi:C-terminal processing protease CtpA/Prc
MYTLALLECWQVRGTKVDEVLPGSPAHASHHIERGDRILEVDGVEATDDNIMALLTGQLRLLPC